MIYDQLDDYLASRDLSCRHQSGLRSKFSTDTCLLHLTDFIRFNIDNGNCVGMVLFDLQKVFYTVDHPILLMKLEALGLMILLFNDFVHTFQIDNS